LTRKLHARVADDCRALADLLALIGEFDSRKLFAPAGYPSMYAYCLGKVHLSEAAVYKRITAGRKDREFPEILAAIAAGYIHPSAIAVLASHFTRENVAELLGAARHRTKSEVEQLVAERFPRPDVVTSITSVSAPAPEPAQLEMITQGEMSCDMPASPPPSH